jgi:hypothetical protein
LSQQIGTIYRDGCLEIPTATCPPIIVTAKAGSDIMSAISVSLKPYEWVQSIRYEGSKVEGRRSIRMQARVEAGHRILLSSNDELSSLNIDLQIVDLDPAQMTTKPLTTGFGVFVYRDALRGLATHIGGWFCLDRESYAELWDQVREGGYSDCRMTLNLEPAKFDGAEWIWDVGRNLALFITWVSIEFTRKPVSESSTKEKLGWWSLFTR